MESASSLRTTLLVTVPVAGRVHYEMSCSCTDCAWPGTSGRVFGVAVLAVVGQVELCECGTLSNPSDDKSRESREKVQCLAKSASPSNASSTKCAPHGKLGL
jgi:hypothetical protein